MTTEHVLEEAQELPEDLRQLVGEPVLYDNHLAVICSFRKVPIGEPELDLLYLDERSETLVANTVNWSSGLVRLLHSEEARKEVSVPFMKTLFRLTWRAQVLGGVSERTSV